MKGHVLTSIKLKNLKLILFNFTSNLNIGIKFYCHHFSYIIFVLIVVMAVLYATVTFTAFIIATLQTKDYKFPYVIRPRLTTLSAHVIFQ